MAKHITYQTQEIMDNLSKDKERLKSSHGLKSPEYKEASEKFRLARTARNSQLNHDVHGPVLRVIDEAYARGTSAGSEQPTDALPEETQEASLPLAKTSGMSAQLNRFTEHYGKMEDIKDELDRHYSNEEDKTPHLETVTTPFNYSELNTHLVSGMRHLQHHAQEHDAGNYTEAAKHLNSAAVRLGKAGVMLGQLGYSTDHIPSSAAQVALDYSHKFADGTSELAKNVRSKPEWVPDSLRDTEVISNEPYQDINEKEKSPERQARFAPLVTHEIPESVDPYRKIVQGHTVGFAQPIKVTNARGDFVSRYIQNIPATSVDPERFPQTPKEAFPVSPKEMRELGVEPDDAYTQARKMFNRRYGRALARVVAKSGAVDQSKMYGSQRAASLKDTLEYQTMTGGAQPIVSDQDISSGTRNTVQASKNELTEKLAKRSLFPAPGKMYGGQKAKEARAALTQAVKWFSNADKLHAKSNNGLEIHEDPNIDLDHLPTEYGKSLPDHLRSALGPHGLTAAITIHMQKLANRDAKESIAQKASVVPEYKEEEARSTDLADSYARSLAGVDTSEPLTPRRRGGRGGSMSAFRGE